MSYFALIGIPWMKCPAKTLGTIHHFIFKVQYEQIQIIRENIQERTKILIVCYKNSFIYITFV